MPDKFLKVSFFIFFKSIYTVVNSVCSDIFAPYFLSPDFVGFKIYKINLILFYYGKFESVIKIIHP